MRSKKISHFIKEKNSLILIETMFSILKELEHLEILVKLAKQKRDAKLKMVKVVKIILEQTYQKFTFTKPRKGK
jgi:hypothetical protein